jgi:hypothetical protein
VRGPGFRLEGHEHRVEREFIALPPPTTGPHTRPPQGWRRPWGHTGSAEDNCGLALHAWRALLSSTRRCRRVSVLPLR